MSFISAVIQCTDGDGGLNYNLKGTVNSSGIADVPGSNPFNSSVTDFCSTSKILNEYICNLETTQTGLGWEVHSYECPISCKDGACSETACSDSGSSCSSNVDCCSGLSCINNQCKTPPVCTDTDGGINYNMKGTATSTMDSNLPASKEDFANSISRNLSTFTDFCLNNVHIEEYSCGSNGFITVNSGFCQYACENDACVSSCRNSGQSCSQSAGCCPGQGTCVGNFGNSICQTSASCQSSTQSCSATSDCCSGLICSGGVCLTPQTNQTSCKSFRSSCSSSLECCKEFSCIQNQCRTIPSTNPPTTPSTSVNNLSNIPPTSVTTEAAGLSPPSISVAEIISSNKIVATQISNVTLEVESDKLIYTISGTKEGKLFWIISVSAKVEQKIDANSGEVISTKKPWWSFLAGI